MDQADLKLMILLPQLPVARSIRQLLFKCFLRLEERRKPDF